MEGLDEQGGQILDNINFLEIAATVSEFQPPLEGPVVLSEEVERAFLSESGAEPIDSVETLTAAMNVLFRDRV